ncbi:tannase/feruloyl esterase family alpha/beta hydrolase [Streptomyces canus]|uniref:tannase/feruloyl esterase family alpha/beta hydrolase n=1 Tax=Streptomyces canus TaxID=58343 RepID=UPI0033BA42EF
MCRSYFKKIMQPNEGMYDATDPDLTAFKKAGGKLILWHGLGDQHIPAARRSPAASPGCSCFRVSPTAAAARARTSWTH